MNYGRLADLVVVLHFCFVLFVLFGGVLALRWPRVVWVHLPAAVWGALIEFAGWICPLTPLENWLRRQGGIAGYEGGFVEHYVLPVLYPGALTRNIQLVLGVIVLLLNIVIYRHVLRRRRVAMSR
ncbi:MAG TPA: DUF2784 domain-containing protein [Gemmatimonadales bacterium]|nr:DUF2784 domain-containing protein [Gemmatimonadales bacterium]